MNTYELLTRRIKEVGSLLCVGLDPDISLLDSLGLGVDDFFELNKLIIDSSYEFASAFKVQFAYYSALGMEHVLQKVCEYIKDNYSNIPVILDAKRGDISDTAKKYAIEAFDRYKSDAVTINPYMGRDSIIPFLDYKDKATIVLIKTSNLDSGFIQDLRLDNNQKVYEYVAKSLSNLYSYEQLWFVVGGIDIEAIKHIRFICPNNIFLIPGVGTQGGNIRDILQYALGQGDKKNILINVSRGIINNNNKISLKEYILQVRDRSKQYYLEIKNNIK